MERVLTREFQTSEEQADAATRAECALLAKFVAADAKTFVLIGAGTGAGLEIFLAERPSLRVVILEPDPRAAEGLFRRLSADPTLEDRATVVSGPNYAGSDEIGERVPDVFRAPVVIQPALAARHPREVARAQSIAARFTLRTSDERKPKHGDAREDKLLSSSRLASTVAEILDGARVLSVDAFDTLLMRAVAEPADVFPIVGRRALEQGLVAARITPSQFALLRKTSEERARQRKRASSNSTEVNLTEIYAEWPIGSDLEQAALARLEVQVESEVVYAHPATLALLEEAEARGLGTALVSDTYFSREELSTLLIAAGISPRLFDVILTSSDAGCSKHDGRLFERLQAQWPNIPSALVVHLGDHAHADVRQAERAGFRARQHDTGRTGVAGDAMRLETLRYGAVLPELASMRGLAGTIDRPADADAQWHFALGAAVLGPALAAFADWIVAEAIRDGIRTIRPLMREGALFADLISASARARGVDLDVRPLFVSRSATWLASLDTFDDEAIRKVLIRQHLTIAEVCRELDIEGDLGLSPVTPFMDRTLGAAASIETPGGLSLAELFGECLGRQSVRDRATAAASGARSLVRAYLDEACGPARDVALVDLGFRCSIGQAIERVTASSSQRAYHHFLLFATERVARLWTQGKDVRIFGAGPLDENDLGGPIARHPTLLECLLIEGGTTIGYVNQGVGTIPVLAQPAARGEQLSAIAVCKTGIKRFQQCWLDWSVNRPALARRISSNRRGLIQPIHRLLTLPTADEAARLGSFIHEDNEGGNSTRPLANIISLPPDVTADDFLRSATSGSAAFGQSWLWPGAICEQRWPGLLERRWRDAAGTVDGAPPVMPALAARMRQAGIRDCTVWGAGEAGLALIRALRREAIAVSFVTDSNPTHWGSTLDGVPVIAPGDTYARGQHVFAIGSCAFAAEIAHTIRQHYQGTETAVRVFSPLAEEAL